MGAILYTFVGLILLEAIVGPQGMQATKPSVLDDPDNSMDNSTDDLLKATDVAYGAEHWLDEANACYKKNDISGAIEALDKAIEIDSKNAKAWIGKGNALNRLGEYNQSTETLDEATKAFDIAIEIAPQNVAAWIGKGTVLIHKAECDRRDEERNSPYPYQITAEQQKKASEARMARVLYRNRLYDEAIECFNKAIEINPQSAEAWYNKGNALSWQDNDEDACPCFHRARDLGYRGMESMMEMRVIGKYGMTCP